MQIDTEIWRKIENHPSYEVSNFGRIRSLKRKNIRVLRQHKHKDDYLCVILFTEDRQGTRLRLMVHREVAKAFLDRPEGKDIVCHNDGNINNNQLSNLRWATQKENIADKTIHGTMVHGSRVHCSKLNEEQIKGIRNSLLPTKELAAAYGVSTVSINNILRRKVWKHV